MPKFDGTGPQGQGPMTGRGFGPCGGFVSCTPHCGMGWGMGRGGGFGKGSGMGFGFSNCHCCGWNQPQTKKDQLKALSEHKKYFEEKLEYIKKKEKELSKAK